MREREGGSSTIQFGTRHSFLLRLYGETLFEFISPPEFRQNKKRSKRRIPPQTPPPPLATSEFRKKESAEVLRNPFPENCFRKTSSALFQISSSGFFSKKVRILSRAYRKIKTPQTGVLILREASKVPAYFV